MDIPENILTALRVLSPADRHLVAGSLNDTEHLVEDDLGDYPPARRDAYKALSRLVWEVSK